MQTYPEKKVAFRHRTNAFASQVIRLYIGLDKRREEIRIMGKQLLRAGTSVAANYRECSRSRSQDEFISKVEICCQETDETQLWLELLRDDCGIPAKAVEPIWQEANELISIFVTMARNAKAGRE